MTWLTTCALLASATACYSGVDISDGGGETQGETGTGDGDPGDGDGDTGDGDGDGVELPPASPRA